MPDGGTALKDAPTARWQALRREHVWLDHALRGYGHYKDEHGDHLAAAITFFSFLALFPLILLGVSITGFVLAGNATCSRELFDKIAKNAPGGFGNTLTRHHQRRHRSSVRRRHRRAGRRRVDRTGLDRQPAHRDRAVWGRPAPSSLRGQKSCPTRWCCSASAWAWSSRSASPPSAPRSVTSCWCWLNLDGMPGMGTLTAVLALVLAILGDLLIFGWVMIRLPDAPVSRRTAIRASLLAAVGFEILKIVGTYYIAKVTGHRPEPRSAQCWASWSGSIWSAGTCCSAWPGRRPRRMPSRLRRSAGRTGRRAAGGASGVAQGLFAGRRGRRIAQRRRDNRRRDSRSPATTRPPSHGTGRPPR